MATANGAADTGWLDALTAALRPRYEAYLRDLETLVNLDSGTFDREDVEHVGAWLRARCAVWGAAIEDNAGGELASSFAATLHGTGSEAIVLLGHMDTVFLHGTTSERPFRLVEPNALGPGVCDMKGGLLCAVYAIEALRDLRYDHFATLRFICTSDEEIGAPSSRSFVERLSAGADAALVLEAARANGDLVGQRRGWGSYRLEVTGRSAHAGVEPQLGRSAALTLCRQAIALHELNDYTEGRTVNVGTLQAGTRPNVVPDHAVAEIDLRANTPAAMERLLADADAALSAAAIEGTTYTWTAQAFRPPWGPNPGTDRLLAIAQRAAAALGFSVGGAATGGTSDGNFTAALNIPTLDGLGPIGGLDHGPNEYIELASILPRTALLAGVIRGVCER
jgi:glutamate carboxypeptidase